MSCHHRPVKKIKVLHIGADHHVQMLEHCLDCKAQLRKQVKEVASR